MAKTPDALPSWSQVEQSPSFAAADAAQKQNAFNLWEADFLDTAAEHPDSLTPEGWQDFRKKAAAKRLELSGADPLTQAADEADNEADEDPVPNSVALAKRKRELEKRAATMLGLGENVAVLAPEERDELTKLREVVTDKDEEDLDAIEETAADDRESHVVGGKFFASPSLALDKEKYRAAVRAADLTTAQKVAALQEGKVFRERVGARMKADIDKVNSAFEGTRLFGIGPELGGAGKFDEFVDRHREANPDDTDADVMEAWQKENGSWHSNLGTQIKLGGLQAASDLIGTYYGLKRLAGSEDADTAAMAEASTQLSGDVAAGVESVGGATLAADTTSMVLSSLATAPAGLAGRGIVAAGRAAAGLGARAAAAATAGRIGASAMTKAALLRSGTAAGAKLAAKQAAVSSTGGLAVASLAAGAQSAGGAFNQYFDQFLKEELADVPEEGRTPAIVEAARRRARDGARARALVSGLATMAITAGFGATGAEKLAAPPTSKATEALKDGMFVFLARNLGKEAQSEAVEEGLDQAVNEIVDKIAVDPSKPVGDIIKDVMKSAVSGGLLGGAMNVPFALSDLYEAHELAKQDPNVSALDSAARRASDAGAPEVAKALGEQATAATEENLTQAELDQRAADEAAAAAAALDAGVDPFAAGPPEPIVKPEVTVTPADGGAAPAPAPVATPPTEEQLVAIPEGQTYTDPTGGVWTRRSNQFGEPVFVSTGEGGAQLRVPVKDFVANLGRVQSLAAGEPTLPPTPQPLPPATAPQAPALSPAMKVVKDSLEFVTRRLEDPTLTQDQRDKYTFQAAEYASILGEPAPAATTPAPKPQTPTTDDTQAKEPQASGVPPVEGKPAVEAPAGEAEGRAAPGTRKGKTREAKAVVRKAVKEVALARVQAAVTAVRSKLKAAPITKPKATVEVLKAKMFEDGHIPNQKEIAAAMGVSLQKTGPVLKQLTETWEASHPTEGGKPTGYLTGAAENSTPVSTSGKSVDRVRKLGGAFPYKKVGDQNVGFFTNKPRETAQQINAGLKVTVPAALARKVAAGIELSETANPDGSFDVVSVTDPSVGAVIEKAGDWSKAYRTRPAREAAAAAALKAGEKNVEKIPELLSEIEAKNAELRDALTGRKSPKKIEAVAKAQEALNKLRLTLAAALKVSRPMIPFVGRDEYVAAHEPDEVPGEGPALQSYLLLKKDGYLEKVIKSVIDMKGARLREVNMVEEVRAGVVNSATVQIRRALRENPSIDPATIAGAKRPDGTYYLQNLDQLTKDVVKDFEGALRSYGSPITGSVDEVGSDAEAAAQTAGDPTAAKAIELADKRLDEGDQSRDLSPEEIDELNDVLLDINDGSPFTTFDVSVLTQNPAQARRVINLRKVDRAEFRVGSDGEIIFDHGEPLNVDERQALATLLIGVESPGDNKLLTRLATRPNFGRALLTAALRAREILKKSTPVGRSRFADARSIDGMNLVELLRAANIGGHLKGIIKDASANIATVSATSSVSLRQAWEAFSEVLGVQGTDLPPLVMDEERAAVDRAVAERLPELETNLSAEQTRINEEIAIYESMLVDYREDLKGSSGRDADRLQAVIKEVENMVTALRENLAKVSKVAADVKEAKPKIQKRIAAAPAPAPQKVDAARKKVAKMTAARTRQAKATRRKSAKKSPTTAVNNGIAPAMALEVPTPDATTDELRRNTAALAELGVSGDMLPDAFISALRKVANTVLPEGRPPMVKFLSKLFADNPQLLGGVKLVSVMNDASLASAVSVIDGTLVVNVAAMPAASDTSTSAPETLMRGLLTHATSQLTAPGAVISSEQRTALRTLDELRKEAIDVEARTRASGLEPRHSTALGDTAAFVTAVLTDPQFAAMLMHHKSKVRMGLKSLWSRVWNAVANLLTGQPSAFGSTLHNSLMASGRLLTTSPAPNESFMSDLMATLDNPEEALPRTDTPGADEQLSIAATTEAVAAADNPDAVDTVQDRLLGDESPESDPEDLASTSVGLPGDTMLGSSAPDPKLTAARTGEGKFSGTPTLTKVTVVKLPTPQPPKRPRIDMQEAFAGLVDAVETITLLDEIGRGETTVQKAGGAVMPSAVSNALEKIDARIAQLRRITAVNRDYYIELLKDMRAFLQLEVEQIAATPRSEGVAVALELDPETLPPTAPEIEEESLVAEAADVVMDPTGPAPVDLTPFIERAMTKTGRQVAIVDGVDSAVAEQPISVRHDRSDQVLYVNRRTLTKLIQSLTVRGVAPAAVNSYIDALFDRESSTLAILHRFSDGELLATAADLPRSVRTRIAAKVRNLRPGDPGYAELMGLGAGQSLEEKTAARIQLACDYFRMMRQVSESGHTTEDVTDLLNSSRGTMARTVAFLRATARQFLTWWNAYGDFNATKAILNLDDFLTEAGVTPPNGGPAAIPPRPANEEVPQIYSQAAGRTVDQARQDLQEVEALRQAMREGARPAFDGSTPNTTAISEDEATNFVLNELGLVHGDPASIVTALKAVASMEGVDPARRKVAEYLAAHADIATLRGLSLCIGARAAANGNAAARPSGAYDTNEHAISLNLGFTQPGLKGTMQPGLTRAWIMETLLHESAHAVTSVAFNNYLAGSAPDTVKQAFADIDQLRKAIVDHVKGSPEADEFAYQLQDPEEFVAGVMTNPRFSAWLATLPTTVGAGIAPAEGRVSVIKRILSRIYQAVFPDLLRDSALEKSLDRIFDIAANPQVVIQPGLVAPSAYGQFPTVADAGYAERALAEEAAYLGDMPRSEDTSAVVPVGDTTTVIAGQIAAAATKFAPAAPVFTGPPVLTGVVKETQALKRSLPTFTADVESYLKASPYVSSTEKGDLAVVNKEIGPRLAAATDAAGIRSIHGEIELSLGFTPVQQVLAKAVLLAALRSRVADLDKVISGAPTSAALRMREEHANLEKEIGRKLQDQGSGTGQMLNAYKVVNDLLNPRTLSSTYRDSLMDVAKGGLPADADALLGELTKASTDAAATASKRTPLTKKIAEATAKTAGTDIDDVRALFDILEATAVREGSIPAQMAEWVSEKVIALLHRKLGDAVKKAAAASGEPEASFFEAYSDEVKRLVSARVSDAIAAAATPKGAPLTKEQVEKRREEALRKSIIELVDTFEYAPSVERALDRIKAKTLAGLEAKKDSSPESLKRYEDARKALADLKFDLVPLKDATHIVRQAFHMKEEIFRSLAEQRVSIDTIVAMVTQHSGVTKEQASKVAAAFKAAYEAEANRLSQQVLENYAARQRSKAEGDKAAKLSRSARFLRMVRLGGLRRQDFYEAMALEFGLPTYDPAVADSLDKEAERIDAMPVGSLQRLDATRELNSRIVSELYRSMLTAHGILALKKNPMMLRDYVVSIPVAMWKSAVLSGFGTHEVNFGMGLVQSFMDLATKSVGYAVKARDPRLFADNFMTMLKAATPFGDAKHMSEVWTEMKRAAITGKTRFASEQSENLLILERDIPPIDLPVIKQLMSVKKNSYKLMGRIMGVIDSTVAVPASLARQRLAMQYALTMSGKDRRQIAEIMRSAFSPDDIESREIEAMIEQERPQFAGMARPDLAIEARRNQLREMRRAEIYRAAMGGEPTPEDFIAASRESAQVANLSSPPVGITGVIFDGLFGTLERKTGGALSWLFSFPRAMGNLADFGLAWSVPGIGVARAFNWNVSNLVLPADHRYRRKVIEPGSIEFYQQMAQGVLALAAQTAIMVFYLQGLEDEREGREPMFMVYGKGYPDYMSYRNQQLRNRPGGWAPQTVKIGSRYFNWKDIPGFNIMFAALAETSDQLMAVDVKDPAKIRTFDWVANFMVSVIKASTVKQSMQGLTDAAELLTDNDFVKASIGTQVGKLAANFVGGATNPRIVRDVGSMVRGAAGGGEFTLKDGRSLNAAVLSMIPLNEFREGGDMVNVLGRPVTNFWYAPLTKRPLPAEAGPSNDAIITPLVGAGLFIKPLKPADVNLTTFKRGSSEIDPEGGPLSAFPAEAQVEAIQIFGQQMTTMLSPDLIKSLTDMAARGKAGREQAQEILNDLSTKAREVAKDRMQTKVFSREITPHWDSKPE